MPTRFAKQLSQIVRGCVAVGMSRKRALALAIRCARDSIPPLRLEILLDVAKHPDSRPGDVRERINKPWRTTKREMEALNMLGLLRCEGEKSGGYDTDEKERTVWRYRLADGFDRATLLATASADEPPTRPGWG
jgi:DNA-binding transcriptional ArsR family regulator